jgi:hypothetical protein
MHTVHSSFTPTLQAASGAPMAPVPVVPKLFTTLYIHFCYLFEQCNNNINTVALSFNGLRLMNGGMCAGTAYISSASRCA